MFIFPFSQTLYAAAGQSAVGDQPGFIVQMLPFILIAVIFYFLIIRPQQKKAKAHKTLLSKVKRGDKIILTSGLFGKVSKVYPDKNFISVDIDDKGTIVKVLKDTVIQVEEQSSEDKGSSSRPSSNSRPSNDDDGESNEKRGGNRPRRSGRGTRHPNSGPQRNPRSTNRKKPDEDQPANNDSGSEAPKENASDVAEKKPVKTNSQEDSAKE